MMDPQTPSERAEMRMRAADAARDAKALGALAHDAGMCECRDAVLGLPTNRPITQYEDPANYEIEPFDEMTGPHDGTKPGAHTASRTDAASLSVAEATNKEHEAEAEHNACGVVESAAWDVLVGSGLTDEQHKLLSAYHTRVYRTRDAYIKLVHARAATSFAIRMNGGVK